jgi:hypothetical protein
MVRSGALCTGVCPAHSVLGTCVLLLYLMTAHTGLMFTQQLTW